MPRAPGCLRFHGNIWSMEVLQEKVAFCRKDQGPGVKWQCKLLLVDFQKLLSASTDAVNDEATGGASFCEVSH